MLKVQFISHRSLKQLGGVQFDMKVSQLPVKKFQLRLTNKKEKLLAQVTQR